MVSPRLFLFAFFAGQHWYYANTRSKAVPQGFNQEETIKAIWSEDLQQ